MTWARAGFKLDLVNAVVLPDGKVSLPAELREALGLTPGTVLEIQNQSGKIVAWKKPEPRPESNHTGPFTFSLPGGLVTADQVEASLEDEEE